MRLLFAIPHFYDPHPHATVAGRAGYGSLSDDPAARAAALAAGINSLHQSFASAQCIMQIAHGRTQPANEPLRGDVDVIVCTTGGRHLLDRLPLDPAFFHHQATTADPPLLGFECHAALRDRYGGYDWYGFLEDDLVVRDSWLFVKLAWFQNHLGPESVLLPNRYELGTRPLVTKVYLDGDLREDLTAPWQNVREAPELASQVLGRPVVFRRALNPHSGCFFLTAGQLGQWLRQPHFLDRDTSFIGPLESAASLGVMRTFRVYKPGRENASFLEIEHAGTRFLSQLRRPEAQVHSTGP
ncbi:MAG TPA: hypothetical protein VML55_19675 [Planctomycetaceae bacterium]|nr:hypothetical protein [Planctomycetaceae bacterium]